MRIVLTAIALGSFVGLPSPALAQRFSFERSFDVTAGATLDVTTLRGKIDVTAIDGNRIVVAGTVTVQMGWNVPANAQELARTIAAQPPVERDGNVVRLRRPADNADERAVTVAYEVKVPRDTGVATVSNSGATTIRGVSGAVTVQTQSAAIELDQLGGKVTVTTGSGAVTADDIGGALSVTTSSSAVTGRSLKGDARVRTRSGAVELTLAGAGGADVATGSSAIRLAGLRGTLNATTQSGAVTAEGAPGGAWQVSTGSSAIRLSITAPALTIDAASDSGSVTLAGGAVDGLVSKRKISGEIGKGGPRIGVRSRSGSVNLNVAPR